MSENDDNLYRRVIEGTGDEDAQIVSSSLPLNVLQANFPACGYKKLPTMSNPPAVSHLHQNLIEGFSSVESSILPLQTHHSSFISHMSSQQRPLISQSSPIPPMNFPSSSLNLPSSSSTRTTTLPSTHQTSRTPVSVSPLPSFHSSLSSLRHSQSPVPVVPLVHEPSQSSLHQPSMHDFTLPVLHTTPLTSGHQSPRTSTQYSQMSVSHSSVQRARYPPEQASEILPPLHHSSFTSSQASFISHRSLPSLSEDVCSFPVSVSDKLPQQVMELDDEEPKFDDRKDSSVDPMSDIERFLSPTPDKATPPSVVQTHRWTPPSQSKMYNLDVMSQEYQQRSKTGAQSTSKSDPTPTPRSGLSMELSQDIFSSQETSLSVSLSSGPALGASKDSPRIEESLTTPVKFSTAPENQRSTPLTPCSPVDVSSTRSAASTSLILMTEDSPSNRKRKMTSSDAAAKKFVKGSDGGNEDVVVLETKSPANKSIEVIYEKQEPASGTPSASFMHSQDLHLFLSEDTQMASQKIGASRDKEDLSQNNSPSLLSMPDSDRLTCLDAFSSFEEPPDNTLRASQVERLCPPAVSHSQPTIEPLLTLPLKDKTPNSSSDSTKDGSLDKIKGPSDCSHMSNGTSDESQEFTDGSAQSTASAQSSKIQPVKELVVTCPEFGTPAVVTPDNGSQSLFFRAVTASERQKEDSGAQRETDKSLSTYPLLKDSFDDDSPTPDIKTTKDQSSLNDPAKDSTNSKYKEQSSQMEDKSGDPLCLGEFSGSRVTEESQSKILAPDSDEEGSDSKIKQILKKKVGLRKTSTPNSSSNGYGPNISDGQSSISPMNSLTKTPVSDNLVSSNSKSPEVIQISPEHEYKSDKSKDTEDISFESKAFKSLEDVRAAGGVRGDKTVTLEDWTIPGSQETVYVMVQNGKVVQESTTTNALFSLVKPSKFSSSSSSGSNRLSDISRISKASSLGYFADASSSSHSSLGKLESTRLSMASVVSGASKAPSNGEMDQEVYFIPPNPPEFARKVFTQSVLTQTEEIPAETSAPKRPLSDSTTSTDEVVKVPKRKGRLGAGRGRGRPKGSRARDRGGLNTLVESPVVLQPTEDVEEIVPVKSEEVETKVLTNVADVKDKDPDEVKSVETPIKEVVKTDDGVASLLPDSLVKRLKEAHMPLTVDEEEIFLNKKEAASDKQRQYSEVINKIRVTEIKPNTLVFARYNNDNRYYSATVQDFVKPDKWRVLFNLDGCKCAVRDVYILPTEILSKGVPCYAWNTKQSLYDPGLVKGHAFEDGLLLHLIELYTGIVSKVAHSHIALNSKTAEEMLEPRRNHQAITESPGREISWNNIVPGGRRGSSKTSHLSPLVNKTPKSDPHFDSSDNDKTTVSKKRVALYAVSSSSGSLFDSSDYGKKRGALYSVSSSSDPELDPPKSASKSVPSTSSTPKQKSKKQSRKTPAKKARKQLKEEEPQVDESNPVLESKEAPKLDMNPRVELFQLPEVSASPKHVPLNGKRQIKRGSESKNPKKYMKIDPSLTDDEVDETVLGPLPPPGCDIFAGYSVLITHGADSPYKPPEESSHRPIMKMDRDHLVRQIEGGGGLVLATFDDAYKKCIESLPTKKAKPTSDTTTKKARPTSDTTTPDKSKVTDHHEPKYLPASQSPARILCVSNTFCRTEKYIQCLTVGLPLVNLSWVVESIREGSCVNWLHHLLPAGQSIVWNQVMEQVYEDKMKDISQAFGRVVNILDAQKVFLATSSNPNFGELWFQLLNVAKASIFRMPPDRSGNLQRLIDRNTWVVIADPTIPEEELARANKMKVPVVSSEWFIQSLIARWPLDFDGHPQFKHTYVAPS